MKIINIVSLLVLGIFLLASCNNSQVYNKYTNIENHKWDKDSAISFSFNAEDTINHYDVLLNIRHNSAFRFQNSPNRFLTSNFCQSKIVIYFKPIFYSL